jgi:potassium voltage-gated channel Eag-related subfamily H protein 7
MKKSTWKTTKIAPEKPATMHSDRYDDWEGERFIPTTKQEPVGGIVSSMTEKKNLPPKENNIPVVLNKAIVTNITKLFDKQKPKELTKEEQSRQAKVAELVEQEALVLNADQLALIQKRNTHPFTISKNSPRRFLWDFIISLSTTYVILVTPVKAGFGVNSTGASYVLDVLMDAIYLLDIVLNFFTSYIDETTGEEIKILHKIRTNYIYGWLLLDAISSFPSSLIGTTNSLLTMMKILKGARILKLQETGLSKAATGAINHSMNPSVLRMFKLTIIFLLSQHFIACSYYYVSNAQEIETSWSPSMDLMKNASLQEKYIDAFYFAIMVTTANDVNPTNGTEKIFTSIMLILGILINASIIGSAANLLSNLDKAEIARKNQLDSINEYLRFKKVPLQLQDKIRRYYEYVLSSRMIDPTENLLADLPDRLKLSLKLNLHNEFMKKVPLFKVCSTEGIIAIVQCMKNVIAMPGDLIIVSGEMVSLGKIIVSIDCIQLLYYCIVIYYIVLLGTRILFYQEWNSVTFCTFRYGRRTIGCPR